MPFSLRFFVIELGPRLTWKGVWRVVGGIIRDPFARGSIVLTDVQGPLVQHEGYAGAKVGNKSGQSVKHFIPCGQLVNLIPTLYYCQVC